MLKISTKSQYGLRAMVYLAKCRGQMCSLKIISEKEGISFDYLEKILSKLEKSGLIRSRKGVCGGYFLGRKPSRIKIGEIINVLEGEIVLVKCMNSLCPKGKKCLTKKFWKKLQDVLCKALNSVTLGELIKI